MFHGPGTQHERPTGFKEIMEEILNITGLTGGHITLRPKHKKTTRNRL